MAEIAASLIAIVTFGAQTTSKLYDIGTCISGIRKEVDHVARNISIYSDVLELLAERLDVERPVHSKKALTLAGNLSDRSSLIFGEIDSLLPKVQADRVQVSFSIIEKIKWYFRRKHVTALVAELECLKSTANLLLNILAVGRSIRRRRRRKRSKIKIDPELQSNIARTQNSLVDYFNAAEKASEKTNLLQSVDDDNNTFETPLSRELVISPSSQAASILQEPNGTITNLSTALTALPEKAERRQLLRQSLNAVLNELLQEWTCLNISHEEYTEIIETHLTQLSSSGYSGVLKDNCAAQSDSDVDSTSSSMHLPEMKKDLGEVDHKDGPLGNSREQEWRKKRWPPAPGQEAMLARVVIHRDGFEVIDTYGRGKYCTGSGRGHTVIRGDYYPSNSQIEDISLQLYQMISRSRKKLEDLDYPEVLKVEHKCFQHDCTNRSRKTATVGADAHPCHIYEISDTEDDEVRTAYFRHSMRRIVKPALKSSAFSQMPQAWPSFIADDEASDVLEHSDNKQEQEEEKEDTMSFVEDSDLGNHEREHTEDVDQHSTRDAREEDDDYFEQQGRTANRFDERSAAQSPPDITPAKSSPRLRDMSPLRELVEPDTHADSYLHMYGFRGDGSAELLKIRSLRNDFLSQFVPAVQAFIDLPPSRKEVKQRRYLQLSETIYENIFEAGDLVKPRGMFDQETRTVRRKLYAAANAVLQELDKCKPRSLKGWDAS